jgi:hypothetical protein
MPRRIKLLGTEAPEIPSGRRHFQEKAQSLAIVQFISFLSGQGILHLLGVCISGTSRGVLSEPGKLPRRILCDNPSVNKISEPQRKRKPG